ncbi:hypothetical protein JR316_0000042 [Psilocybe cubensis]|uniref:Uncharacterized protein n=2 Tax=Psilocybe cubensis TaxID=181762 RepID=A0ACB8HD98_PSICU|nr:hypothetical protein JR316_0000042 [Psilocybe cubensis]KAH9485980.1 hypothetical protein JR316_0000042 [Psilocybe cubensis]
MAMPYDPTTSTNGSNRSSWVYDYDTPISTQSPCVIGPTGSGKSTFINMILGQERMKVGHEQESCTSVVSAIPVLPSKASVCNRIGNRKVLLVDTPGFDNTEVDDMKVLGEITNCLEDLYRHHHTMGGIIYLQDISLDRVSASTMMCIDLVNKACGILGLRHVVLGATKCNRLSAAEVENRMIQLKGVHWKGMMDMGAQAFPLAYDPLSDAQSLLDAVLERFEPGVLLDIQREFRRTKDIRNTSVGKRLIQYISRWKRAFQRIFQFDFF